MLTFSQDGAEADRQMRAVLFYLTTFGYIDGEFDEREQDFIKRYIEQLVQHRVDSAVSAHDAALRVELKTKFTKHFLEVFQGINRQVRDLFTEAVADGENHQQFVESKLKLRCFEIFKSFDAGNQELLMQSIDELIHADGEVHPAEVKFRAELAELLEDDLGVELLDEEDSSASVVAIRAAGVLTPPPHDDPFLEPLEIHYSSEPAKLAEQMRADLALVERTSRTLEDLRFAGSGKLGKARNVSELVGQDPFLDGHIFVESPRPGRKYELTVVGDLHGCYSCLKAVLMQTRFFEKLQQFRRDPERSVCPKLILLGDYIDRGIYSYQGVLRGVLQLFVDQPDHVYLLRGNHEYYFRYQGRVYGGVKPAEAINSLKPHIPDERVFEAYMAMFENLPNLLFFDRFLFVHGGIARDRLLRERFTDLASLNDPDIRFQMMWSDPSSADVIPAALQEQSSRFPFGKLQCQAFLQKVGCHTLIRGHEKVEEGFRCVYDEKHLRLISLFSAGGETNGDLPEESTYRNVTPMAMTIHYQDGQSEIVPFRIQYEAFNDPNRNAFFRNRPEIEHRTD